MLVSKGKINWSPVSDVSIHKPSDVPVVFSFDETLCDLASIVNKSEEWTKDVVLNPFRTTSDVWVAVLNLDFIITINNEDRHIVSVTDLGSLHVDEDSGEELVLAWMPHVE